ncbi:hypothetical protein DL765_001342 [Monosporascus sp. GIB2]|nr:hypothetical protein DL765_001342 [Monosporascus sp. GIB2]
MPDDDETCANPLLLKWIKESLDLARERNSKAVNTYKSAYNALKACPITFTHPSQLQQLKGFGPKLTDRLTEKMKKHCEENGLPMPKRKWLTSAAHAAINGDSDDIPEERPPKKPRKTKPYVPALRSGAYALILGLASLGEDASMGMTKNQLIEAAQPHCDSSFTAPSDPTRFYTAWSSMGTLVDKDLVRERGRPSKRYMLTDEGWEVARRIQLTTDGGQPRPDSPQNGPPQRLEVRQQSAENARDLRAAARSPSAEVESQQKQESSYANVVANGDSSSDGAALPTFRPIRLAPGTFTVELVLDVREIRAKTDRDYMQDELAKKGVKPIMRSLELGDALWVAKCHDANFLSRLGAEGDEVVLDWIVERKRLDDLIGSIKDGRFHEQKFRLKRSGIKNVVYIVEEISMNSESFNRYEEMVQSAIASTQVVNGYFLKKTQKMDDTIRYLTRMTMLLKKQYENQSLFVIPTEILTAQNYLPLLDHLRQKEATTGHYVTYPAFASMASKSEMMTLRDLYLKMLMCTKQVTGEKALEIQKRWKTPYEFVKAFENCGGGEEGKKKKRDLVFSQMGNLVGRKKVGKTLSQKIAEVWGDA